MKFIKNLLKKKKAVEQMIEKKDFTYTIFLYDGDCIKCKGHAPNKRALAIALDDSMGYESFHYSTENGGKAILRSKHIHSIVID
ncbi:MAG: hypothetical protein ABS939_06805 [Psychrobacillus sp.]